ncbi:MAG: 16S rRNA (cytosine(1402)-N(4))-methyltransferase RsmH [Bacteroidetes bacterium]|nr:MAG: 16S rRNA (cytosine(1402)-N(4))-methyltransferase RsmH [Bacteroidota bacterium]
MMYHIPVLAEESVRGLNVSPSGAYVDVTYGGGGHSALILEKLNTGKLLAFDQDPDAKKNLPDNDKLIFINENFRYLKNFLKLYRVIPVDGILADLGVSSWQFDQAERGFSTRFDGPLDMRMDKKNSLSAEVVVNTYDQEQLLEVFKLYGELKNARRIAAEIVFHRQNADIASTEDLKKVLQKLAPRGKENKFFAQVFQALRIEVNSELEVLKDFLKQSLEVIKPGGRLVVISYHSLEDRLVKNFMRSGNFKGEAEKDFFGNTLSPIKQVGKLIIPDQIEQESNPRSRSAKLRIAEIL